jgi:hypothetical protein
MQIMTGAILLLALTIGGVLMLIIWDKWGEP